ncbi:MAG TPA: hypothetical protein VFU22_20005 [Roseiflexaceae bacterium]|nr:hypothetical protein [Roseiflexaceae bacterium]
MAQSTFPQAAAAPRTTTHPWLVIGALTALALLGAFGNAWDLFWHIAIGRDSFWIPPHTMMYAAVALSGLIALAVVLADTLRRAERLSAMLGFRAPLGFYILGLGVLQMLLAAPFDDYWHRRYGVDVSVWSPPHLVGFSGAMVMLCGLIIASTSERQRALPLSDRQERGFYVLLALLLALAVRWIIFLNSTTVLLSWELEFDRYALARPWAPWWGLVAGLCMAWIFVASARCLPGRAVWALPLAVFVLALALRALEYVVGAIGFGLTLPWRGETLEDGFRWFYHDYDKGIWISTWVLAAPAVVIAWLGWVGQRWGAPRFGLTGGVAVGLLLAAQFLLLRPILDLPRLGLAVQAQVVIVTLAASVAGGVVGALQGAWLARFRW